MKKPQPQPGKLTPQPGQTMPNPNMPGEKHDDPIGHMDAAGHMSEDGTGDLGDAGNEKASDRIRPDLPAPGNSA
ncbi:hypothetical protein [Jiella pelagia]|uniref:Sigma-like protein n=1 Tax=Jiella pelagia TaxID=2986949 RepID=A0ABY7C1U9_9HYPH|nr:hypothetical protein [Jiella pelagia]WAP68743.1 hypothetical protein OH818_26430 [Jiella pelagia]